MFTLKLSTFSSIGTGFALLTMLMTPSAQATMTTAITAGVSSTCTLTTAGGVLCWGQNTYGQLGNGSVANSLVPTGVIGLGSGVLQVASGDNHRCALLVGGSVRCWGLNANGQLGNSSVSNSSVPVAVSGLSGAIDISAGGYHSCAVMATGAVKCWGRNNTGQIGDGTLNQRNQPADVLAVSGAVAIALGESHSCALINNGQVKCWGFGAYGALGHGSATGSSTRVDVFGLNDATSIAAGYYHTCAKTSTGAAKCWGHNAYGQLGNGSTVNALVPGDVSGLSSGVAQITAAKGYHSTCATLTNGTAKCWGGNNSGQLGSGDTVNKLTPSTVLGLAGAVSSIAIGSNHACARVNNGVQCWGYNAFGQHGAGNITSVPFPQNTVGLFGVAPALTPAPLSPVTSNSPVYTWKAIPGASSYRLRINGVTTNYTAAAVNCPDGVGLCTFTSALLAPGAYGWQVQGFNEYGAGQWSALTQFVL
jgi:Regulator of chromosome condensation (RCC1) repeat